MNRTLSLFASAGLALALMIPAPALADGYVYVFDQRLPGAYDDVFNLPSLGVIPLRGNDGQGFSATIAGELQQVRIGARAAFAIRTEETGAVAGKSRKAPPDSVFVRAAADRLGVKGIMWGSITASTVQSSNYSKMTQICNGSVCGNVPVQCQKYQGTFVVTPAIYSGDNSRILYQRTIKKDTMIDICAGQVQSDSSGDLGGTIGKVGNLANSGSNLSSAAGGVGGAVNSVGSALSGIGAIKSLLGKSGKSKNEPVAVTPESIMAALRMDAAQEIIADLTPKAHKAKVGFKTRFPEFDKDTQAKLALAIDQLKSGRPDKACGIFQSYGEGAATKQLSLRYNLAACEEVNANYRVAKQLYDAYDKDMTAVDPMLNDALKRMADMKV